MHACTQKHKYAIMHVKTVHRRCPKEFLEREMKDMPGGTWVVLEGRAKKEGLDLVTIGYKYNKKKVLVFLFNRGAGSTAPGEPYEARFPDAFGNVCIRHVARPIVVSRYFKYSNQVDLHNQARQFDLSLEKKWITQDGWFRLYTTILGMTIVDCWKLFRTNKKSNISILDFADELGKDMLEAAKLFEFAVNGPSRTRSGRQFHGGQEHDVQCVVTANASTDYSSLSMNAIAPKTHTREFIKKGQLRCIWCSRVTLIEKKTTMRCIECGKGFCRDGSGYDCWGMHVALNGVPPCPKRGTKKRKVGET